MLLFIYSKTLVIFDGFFSLRSYFSIHFRVLASMEIIVHTCLRYMYKYEECRHFSAEPNLVKFFDTMICDLFESSKKTK